MTSHQFETFWQKAQEEKRLNRNAKQWMELAQIVGELTYAKKPGEQSEQLTFEQWWSRCFDLLSPFQVRIKDIHYLGTEEEPEYLEIINDGPAIIDISGWLIDAGGRGQNYVFPESSLLQPKQCIKVFTSGDHPFSFDFGKRQIWNNTGDTGRLMNKKRNEISTWSYGKENRPLIEIMDIHYDGLISKTEADEFVEIANTSKHWVDIANWHLSSNKNQTFTFPNKAHIPPYGTIRVYTNQVHPEFGGYSFGHGSAIWNNKGDKAELSDQTGFLVSQYAY